MAGDSEYDPIPETWEDKSSEKRIIGLIIVVVIIVAFFVFCIGLYRKKWMQERNTRKYTGGKKTPQMEAIDQDVISSESSKN